MSSESGKFMKMLGDTLFASITNFKHLENGESLEAQKALHVNTTDDTVFLFVHAVKLV